MTTDNKSAAFQLKMDAGGDHISQLLKKIIIIIHSPDYWDTLICLLQSSEQDNFAYSHIFNFSIGGVMTSIFHLDLPRTEKSDVAERE